VTTCAHCSKHFQKAPYARHCSEACRLLSKAIVPNEDACWAWMAHRNEQGYGRIKVGGRCGYAHRMAYELFVGPIPEGMTVDHICFNPSCINPDHLQLLTRSENAGRHNPLLLPEACKWGHLFDEENTYVVQRRSGVTVRGCRTCRRDATNRGRRNADRMAVK
jgi:hypothetical protein